jgi:hypothetical protein
MGAGGFRIALEWAQDMCCDLRRNLPEPVDYFRQWPIVACTLAFDLNRENAQHFIPRTPLYKLTRERNSVVQDLVAFLTAKPRRSLTCGSLYLRCVRQDT